MELFATNETVAKLEADVARLQGGTHALAQMALAWQLRQRDSERALVLAGQCTLSPDLRQLSPEQVDALRLRHQLIQAEAHWLAANLGLAQEMAQSVVDAARDHPLIRADAHYLLAWIALDQGDRARRDQEWRAMLALTTNLEPVRAAIATASLGRFAVLGEGRAAAELWTTRIHSHPHPAAQCWVEDFYGFVAQTRDDYPKLVQHHGLTYTLARETGQIRHAVISASNQSENFALMNDLNSALEWAQDGLNLARQDNWPRTLGNALFFTADVFRLLHRFDSAQAMLEEGLAAMAPLAHSRTYAVALSIRAKLEIDSQQFDKALATLAEVEQRAARLSQIDLQLSVKCHQAQVLFALGKALAALQHAHLVVGHDAATPKNRIDALLTIARIHAACDLRTPEEVVGMSAPTRTLHYLNQALDLVRQSKGNLTSPELFDALSREHAQIGAFEQAWHFALEAQEVRESASNRDASNRAIALQIREQMHRARLESEYHRKMAESAIGKAAVAHETGNTLALLGTIGQEITAHLEQQPIFEVLNRHVHELLDTTALSIYRYDVDAQTLSAVYGMEDGKPVAATTLAMTDPHSNAVRCALERRPILLNFTPGVATPSWIAGTQHTLSCMFAPLLQENRLLGVISVQSVRQYVYGEREQLIFRTLCAYTAIALGNALAHQALREAQEQLIQAEKMATLGQLVANVAHEINTPIGAIKSSGGNISHAVEQVMVDLPKVFKLLNPHEEKLFQSLIQSASTPSPVLTTREERALTRKLREQLQQLAISEFEQIASTLVQMHADDVIDDLLPLLLHRHAPLIFRTAQYITTIINGAANINDAVERVSKIVFALKTFARHEDGSSMHECDLRDTLETVLTLYHNQIKHGIDLIRQYEDIPLVPCFKDQISQVWTNLIHNALQAMQYQGKLGIRIMKRGDYAIVRVSDTGCGIAPEIRDKIFNPFFTTKPVGEGSGLGLDIVKKIVEKHQGKIELQSEVGVGTTFAVFLPCPATS